MMIEAANLDWLRRQGIAAEAEDLETTYSTAAHPLNQDRKLTRQRVDAQRASFAWSVEFYAANDEPVLDEALARLVYPSTPLRGRTETGVVARNAMFYVASEHRRQGFAKVIYVAEESLYRRWGVNEIHLRAQGDGRVAWTRSGFGFQLAEAELVHVAYREWAKDRPETPADPPADLSQYPAPFLSWLPGIELYKVVTP